MMAGGVSVHVATRDARLRPSVMRAMGSRVDVAAGTVTVYLARRQSRELIADLESNGHVAVMFSAPSTMRTVQLKAGRAELRAATEDDRPVLEQYLRAMEREIAAVGYPAPLVRAMFAWRLDDLVALTVTPEQVFEQTPGPKAGSVIAGGGA